MPKMNISGYSNPTPPCKMLPRVLFTFHPQSRKRKQDTHALRAGPGMIVRFDTRVPHSSGGLIMLRHTLSLALAITWVFALISQALADTPNGSSTNMPAYYDGQLFTI